jgi:hypothetical protein
MRYLALALFAEGPSDHEFLPRVILRSTTEISAAVSNEPVEIAEQFIRASTTKNTEMRSRPERVEALFGSALEAIDLLFIHADGQGDSNTAFDERVLPCCNRLHSRFPAARFGCVGVVPVRETEAWAIADADAVTRALGTRKSAQELGLPDNAANVETTLDPKAVLQRAQRIALGGRRQDRARTGSILAVLGETVGLGVLRELPAFRDFENRLRGALQNLWHAA